MSHISDSRDLGPALSLSDGLSEPAPASRFFLAPGDNRKEWTSTRLSMSGDGTNAHRVYWCAFLSRMRTDTCAMEPSSTSPRVELALASSRSLCPALSCWTFNLRTRPCGF